MLIKGFPSLTVNTLLNPLPEALFILGRKKNIKDENDKGNKQQLAT